MKTRFLFASLIVTSGLSAQAMAFGHSKTLGGCLDGPDPAYANVRFEVEDTLSSETIQVNAVLTEPVAWAPKSRCFKLVRDAPGVVFLHGSGGIDARGHFYANALKSRYATLTVEMFKGSIGSGETDRPPLPIFNYSHAFAALDYLIDAEGFIDAEGDLVPEDLYEEGLVRKVKADPDAIGCIGFSWGAVICTQVATETYAQEFGDELYGTGHRYAAHVAHYPVCWARNEAATALGLPGFDFGSPSAPLVGSPVLIQVGSEDAYDNAEGDSGSVVCNELKNGLIPQEQDLVDVVVLQGATHAFDRVFSIPATVQDPFARLGAFLNDNPADDPEVPVSPNLAKTHEALRNMKRFLRRNLR